MWSTENIPSIVVHVICWCRVAVKWLYMCERPVRRIGVCGLCIFAQNILAYKLKCSYISC